MGTLRCQFATVPQPSELRFGVVRAVDRDISLLDGVNVVQGEGEVLKGFCFPFSPWKHHCITDGEMFLIRMQKLHNISVRQMYRWKARFMGFLAIYSVSRSNKGL